MSVQTVCQKCGQQYRVSDDRAGREFRCRECNTVCHVPDKYEYAEEPGTVPPVSTTDADPEITVVKKLEGVLEEFAQTLAPEHRDLDRTLSTTSLKSAVGSESDQTSRHESFSQSRSVRPRSIQPADRTIVDTGSTPSADMESPDRDLDYVTLDKLGEGGMGTVHLARQVALGREVALKQIHQRSSRRQSVRDEFLTEAALTGKLEHPNIVPIHEVGESESGELFYSMKNVKGRAWDRTIDDLTLDQNLEILIDVCDAIAFAHAEGVIHRDLKPQNIMTGGFGEVLVLDWGLAVLGVPGEDVKASAGGTPGYMAPEMVNPPFRVGPRSDVYLLGAILFRFLTGQAPHAGKSARTSLKAVSQNEIVDPDRERIQDLDPTGKLLSVAMQAMATSPADRYQTVGEFQQAVREFETHQESLKLAARAEEALKAAGQSGDYTQYSRSMIGFEEAVTLWAGNTTAKEGIERARQAYALCAEQYEDYELSLSLLDESNPEQSYAIERLAARRDERNDRQDILKKMKRRLKAAQVRQTRLKRMKQGLAASAVLMFAVVTGAAFWINNERIEANAQRSIAEKNEKEAGDEREKAKESAAQAEVRRHEAEANLSLANKNQAQAERNAYYSDMLLAQRHWEDANLRSLRTLLDRYRDREDLKGFEWRFWDRRIASDLLTLEGHTDRVRSVAFSPDGVRLASSSNDRTLKVWDTVTGRLTRTLKGHRATVQSVSFSPDGKWLASGSGDRTVKVWDTATGKETLSLKGHRTAVMSVAFSPNGQRLASESGDRTVKVWDAATGEETLSLVPRMVPDGNRRGLPGGSVAFSPDGVRLISTSGNTLKVWDVASGRLMLTPRGHSGRVESVSFSPDGKRLASAGGDETLRLWDATTGLQEHSFQRLNGPIKTVCFSPDSERLASGSRNRTVKLWDVVTGQEIFSLKGHDAAVASVAFSPDGQRLASASADRTVKVWSAVTGHEGLALRGHTNKVTSISFSPDGKRLASVAVHGTVKLWDAATGQMTLSLTGHMAPVRKGAGSLDGSVAFSPDGQRLVSTSGRILNVWDVASGRLTLSLIGHGAAVTSVAFSPDGRRIASGSSNTAKTGEIKLWDAATGQETLSLKEHAAPVTSVAFSPNGQRLASGSRSSAVKLWDAVTGQEALSLTGHDGVIASVAFSPDGKRLASASYDTTVKVWDVVTGQQVLALTGHNGPVASVSFSQDGQRLASASLDKTVTVWDATTGQEMLTLNGHTDFVTSVSFSPDGTRLASASFDETVKVWDSRPWTPGLRAQFQARCLLTMKREKMNSLKDLQASIRVDQTISELVRQQALDWSELFWKNRRNKPNQ